MKKVIVLVYAILMIFATMFGLTSCKNTNWHFHGKGDNKVARCGSAQRTDEPYSFGWCVANCAGNLLELWLHDKGAKTNIPNNLTISILFDNGQSFVFDVSNVDEVFPIEMTNNEKRDEVGEILRGEKTLLDNDFDKFSKFINEKGGIFFGDSTSATILIGSTGLNTRFFSAMNNSKSFSISCVELDDKWQFDKYTR